ncbi:MAG: FtsW/RodA/SpoVE family cell cycle protein [Clostridia bacterium]|nr:FtsW/RodA/SpoVE family cell cycle protein [Clostridia bacterium]MBQ4460015.1 FtsW/RodA/SpoVE family cell cycle protein [Clostridia bacterium]MBQ6525276.1 FtsW/RodA/SpoVE family cell cycle protein [Clostridia bacterium]
MGNIKDYLVYFWKGTDKLLLFLCLLASSAGVLMVTSATWHTMKEGALIPRDSVAMIVAVLMGLIIAMVISLIDIDIFAKSWYIWGALGIILMVIVLLFGEAPSNRTDARTWINLGFFLFQPSELVKIFFVTTFAVHLDAVRDELNRVRNVALLVLHALIPFVLVAISGDDGSALVFLFIAFAMLFIAGIKWQYIVGVFALAAAAVPLLWFQLNDFQKQRFIVIVDPEKYPATAYQQNLGLQALSNGGILGKGLFKGPYTQSGAVPVSESDMIFTVIGEELGILGCVAAIALIGVVIFRILRDAKAAIAGPAQYIGFGIASMIAIQTFINIAMCLRIGPVIGITLPFFSAGGSANLSLYIGLGLIFSIYRSVYSQTQETNFRLIGVRSPFDDTFHDSASYKEHSKDRSSNSRSSREIEPTRGRLGNDGMSKRQAKKARKQRDAQKKAAQKEAERVQKARMKAQKKAAKKKKKAAKPASDRTAHSATYMKKHKGD